METLYRTEKFWDRTAPFYDSEEKKDELTYLRFIEKAKKFLKVSDVVLDFGCGTGLICNEIAEHVNMIYAIDISAEMIEIARNKASERKIHNINFVYTTISDKRFRSSFLDVIIVHNVMHLLDDPQKVIQRINELLKPGGVIISATPCMGERPLLNSLFTIGGTIGIMPRIQSFKISELEHFFLKENFEIIEKCRMKENSPQCLLIAKKLN